MNSDGLGYKFRNKSDWFRINFNPKLLPGVSIEISYNRSATGLRVFT